MDSDAPPSPWNLHTRVSIGIAGLTTAAAALVISGIAIFPDHEPRGGLFGAFVDPLDAVLAVVLTIAIAILIVKIVVIAALAVSLEVAISTLVLVARRPFGPERVYVAHGVAVAIVAGSAVVTPKLTAGWARLNEGPAHATSVTLYGPDRIPELVVVEVETEVPGTFWYGASTLDDGNGNGSWSGGGEAIATAPGVVRSAFAPSFLAGDDPTHIVIDVWEHAADDARVSSRTFPLDATTALRRVPIRPVAPAELVVGGGLDEAAVAEWLQTRPIEGCASLATGPEQVVVHVDVEGDVWIDASATTSTAAADCVAMLLDAPSCPDPLPSTVLDRKPAVFKVRYDLSPR